MTFDVTFALTTVATILLTRLIERSLSHAIRVLRAPRENLVFTESSDQTESVNATGTGTTGADTGAGVGGDAGDRRVGGIATRDYPDQPWDQPAKLAGDRHGLGHSEGATSSAAARIEVPRSICQPRGWFGALLEPFRAVQRAGNHLKAVSHRINEITDQVRDVHALADATLSVLESGKLFLYGFIAHAGAVSPLTVIVMAGSLTGPETFEIQQVEAVKKYAKYCIKYYFPKFRKNPEKVPDFDPLMAVILRKIFLKGWGSGVALYAAGMLCGKFYKKGVLGHMLRTVPVLQKFVSDSNVDVKLIKKFARGKAPQPTVTVANNTTPVVHFDLDSQTEPEPEYFWNEPKTRDFSAQWDAPPTSCDASCQTMSAKAFGKQTQKKESAPSVLVPETDAGSAARQPKVRKDVSKVAKWTGSLDISNNRPEAAHGTPGKTLPVPNIATFWSSAERKPDHFIGNGVVARGHLMTLGHVGDISTHVEVRGVVYTLGDIDFQKRKNHVKLPNAGDEQMVSWRFKIAPPGLVKIHPIFELSVQDAVTNAYYLDNQLCYTEGYVKTKSKSDGSRFSYTCLTTTKPGSSGSPVFVIDDGAVKLAGLHWGSTGNANVFFGLVESDFQ